MIETQHKEQYSIVNQEIYYSGINLIIRPYYNKKNALKYAQHSFVSESNRSEYVY